MYSQINGTAHAVRFLSEAIAKLGHHVHVFAPRILDGYEKPKTLHFHDIGGVTVSEKTGFVLSAPIHKIFLCQHDYLDISHIHTHATIGSMAINWSKYLGIPMIGTHNSPMHYYTAQYVPIFGKLLTKSDLIWRYERHILDKYDFVHVATKSKKDLLLNYRFKEPIVCMTNGIHDIYFTELKENGIVVESLNGNVPCVLTSAKTGQGIDELLEIINLVAEMEELKYHPSKPASGVIIESYLDSKRGPTATLLIREGTLKNTDIIGTGSTYGKIKSMEDFQFHPIKTAIAGTPVVITGLENVPGVGERFSVFSSIKEAKEKSEKKLAKRKEKREVISELGEKKVLNIILKTDVKGSIEAIYQSLKAIPQEEVIIRILKAEPGDISENDIKLAESSNGKIIGFRVKAPSKIKDIAKRKNVKIYIFEVIYELIQKVRELASSLLEPEIVKKTIGKVKILAIFSKTKRGQIIGGRVIEGQAKKGLAEVIREENTIGKGKIEGLQHNKKDVSFVEKGMECGILFNTNIAVEKGDILEIYEEERIKRNL